ncbi:unnamed protein product [Caenorhabditis sp. 36 PRJEB53466]|nr:unnamed protein product [Caenorhabditis sp. 36 PRJEB53466]
MSSLNYFLLLLALQYQYANATQLDEKRRSCKYKKLLIPSGHTTKSDVIHLQYERDIFRQIIDEECKSLSEKDQMEVRPRRSVRKLFSFFSAKRIGAVAKPIMKGLKGKGKTFTKYAKLPLKYGKKTVSFGVRNNIGDIAETAIESIPDVMEAVNSIREPHEPEGKEENAELTLKSSLESFRGNISSLLKYGKLGADIWSTYSVWKVLGIHPDELTSWEELTSSDVQCVKDDFTWMYSIRFRVNVEEEMEVKAEMCSDFGVFSNNTYEYYHLPNEYLVQRNEKIYSVDGIKCSGTEPNYCPESSLKEEECSVNNVEKCRSTTEILTFLRHLSRNLPTAVVYYGPEEKWALIGETERNYTVPPFNLLYFLLEEGEVLRIGRETFIR